MRVLIVDRQPIFRNALSEIIRSNFPDMLVDEVGCMEQAYSQSERTETIGLLIQETTRWPSGTDGFALLRFNTPQRSSAALLLTAATTRRALLDGSAVFISRSAGRDDFVRTIAEIVGKAANSTLATSTRDGKDDQEDPKGSAGDSLLCLTHQQRRVTILISQGMSNKHIARSLGVKESTVKAHISIILRKLCLTSRTQIAVFAVGSTLILSDAAI